MARQVNAITLALLCHFEGLRLTVYKDVAGRDTIGYGHLIKAGEHFTKITQPQASVLLTQDIVPAAATVTSAVKVPLSDNQFGALVDFTYNLGVGTFLKSSLLTDLNKGTYAVVPAHILVYDHADVNGKEVQVEGLTERREAEAALWMLADGAS